MKFITMITGFAAAATTATAMAIPRPWIPMDVANYRSGSALKRDQVNTLETTPNKRTNNPDIQDQCPCWGCKRDDTDTSTDIHYDITIDNSTDTTLDKRTNNPDIQDQYPCWGCKRDQVNSGVQVDSALNTLETTPDTTPDNADIQERGGPEVYEALIMPGPSPAIRLPVDPTAWYKQNNHPGTNVKEWMWKMLDPYVRPIVKTKIELGEFGEHPEDQPGYEEGDGQPLPEGCQEFDWGFRCEK